MSPLGEWWSAVDGLGLAWISLELAIGLGFALFVLWALKNWRAKRTDDPSD